MSQSAAQHGRRRRARDKPPHEQEQLGLPEMVSLAISLAIVLGLVGVLVYLHLTLSDKPALITAQAMVDETLRDGELFYVPVEVSNGGGKAGQDVLVRLSFDSDDGTRHQAELNVGFLAAGDTVRGTIALPRDPRSGGLEIETIAYLEA